MYSSSPLFEYPSCFINYIIISFIFFSFFLFNNKNVSDEVNDEYDYDEYDEDNMDNNSYNNKDRDRYEIKYKNRLLSTYDDKEEINWNEKIDSIFYDRKLFLEYLKETNSKLEKEWKSRIVMEMTPVGYIVMHYDIFNEGFAYYCDQSGIPYTVLNSVAMKYVLTYRCRDFFIDENIIPSIKKSPFITFKIEEERNDIEKKRKVQYNLTSSHSDVSPFAQLKNRGSQVGSNPADLFASNKNIDIGIGIGTGTGTGTGTGITTILKNKFLSLGKFSNFTILQKQNVAKNLKQQLSYTDYKYNNSKVT